MEPEGSGSEGWGAQHFAFFFLSLSCPTVRSFFCSLSGSSRGIVFRGSRLWIMQCVRFGFLRGSSCSNPSGHRGPPGVHKRTPGSPNVHREGPQRPPTTPRENPQREHQSDIFVWRAQNKRGILDGPGMGGSGKGICDKEFVTLFTISNLKLGI